MKKPAHLSQRVGHVVPGVVAPSSVVYRGWEGKMVVNLVEDLCPIVDSTIMYSYLISK